MHTVDIFLQIEVGKFNIVTDYLLKSLFISGTCMTNRQIENQINVDMPFQKQEYFSKQKLGHRVGKAKSKNTGHD